MLYYFDKNKIRKGQAFKRHNSFSFGAWNKNPMGMQEIQEITLNNVYEHWSFEATTKIYFNGVVIEKSFTTFNDFYGLGESILATQETIDLIVKRHKLTPNDKLEIRVFAKPVCSFHYYENNELKSVPNNWYVSYKDIKAYHELSQDERYESKTEEKYNLNKSYYEEDYIEVYSSFKDGFKINHKIIKTVIQELVEKHDLTVSSNEIILER